MTIFYTIYVEEARSAVNINGYEYESRPFAFYVYYGKNCFYEDIDGDGLIDFSSNPGCPDSFNQPPEIVSIGNKQVDEGQLLSFTLEYIHPGELECSVSNLPAGANFDSSICMFSWTPGFDQAGIYPDISFIIKDVIGLPSNSETIRIIVGESPICGNGIIEASEQCDDENTLNGDGCSSICEIEIPSCGLTSASWREDIGMEGNGIILDVNEQNCQGKLFKYDIYEDDMLIDDLIDSFISTSLNPIWIMQYVDDGVGDPEYYFEVSDVGDGGEFVRSSPPDLVVTPEIVPEGTIEINNCAGLSNIRNDLDGNYWVVTDIDFAQCDISYSTDPGFEPIQNFKGTFDGRGNVIKNLYINSNEDYVGLFGIIQVTDATIKNVGLIDVDITGSGDGIGGVVGRTLDLGTYDLVLENVYVTGSVVGEGGNVGGIVGINGGVIRNSYSTANVQSSGRAGGLVASADGSSIIENSYATGDVVGTIQTGGLVGLNHGIIRNGRSTGSVSSNPDKIVGGLVGWNIGNSPDYIGSIENSYYRNHSRNPSVCVGLNTGGSVDCVSRGDIPIGEPSRREVIEEEGDVEKEGIVEQEPIFFEGVLFEEDQFGSEYDGYIIEFDKPPLIKITEPEESTIDKVFESSPLTSENTEVALLDYKQEFEINHENTKQQIFNSLSTQKGISINQEGISIETEPSYVEFKNTFNGIAMDISENEANIIETLPGVKKVYKNLIVNITLQDSVPLINADDVWQLDANGNNCVASGEECLTGKGVSVAILDTGVDYTHEDLGASNIELFERDFDRITSEPIISFSPSLHWVDQQMRIKNNRMIYYSADKINIYSFDTNQTIELQAFSPALKTSLFNGKVISILLTSNNDLSSDISPAVFQTRSLK